MKGRERHLLDSRLYTSLERKESGTDVIQVGVALFPSFKKNLIILKKERDILTTDQPR